MLFVVALSTTLLYNFFLQQERIRLIDQQVRDTAETLLGSELAELNRINMNRAERIISEELGKTRIGKFFILHGENEQTLFESNSAQILKIKDIPQDKQWVTIRQNGQYIRVVNLALPRIEGRTLQVGLVIDEEILFPPLFSKSTIAYFFTTIFTGLLVSFFLTSILLKPIRRIADFILQISANNNSYYLPKPPALFSSITRYAKNDEFVKLIDGFNNLIEKVNKGYSLSRMWSYQMAHELKTPLAIMETEIAIAEKQNTITPELKLYLQSEINNLSEVISSFLSWAEIENTNRTIDIHSLKVSTILQDLCSRLSRKYENRLQLEINTDFYIESNPYHLEILLQNILSNSLLYSSKVVTIYVEDGKIIVEDRGSGIPTQVMERIGEPFNFIKNQNQKSSGLGLAFIYSVAKIYSWKIDLKTDITGTRISIFFHK